MILLLPATTIIGVIDPVGLTHKKNYADQIYVDHLGKIKVAKAYEKF